ncbi:hypothetical protein, conserved [Leishmania tarentolae]|uniref:Transmembrane protein n=1 Tax=Leishmania tarentolae TaxID=5689 RepID=A0A640KFK9_LEITA|nr:hypothetical protein, conserved [Leishmania tarentolae]
MPRMACARVCSARLDTAAAVLPGTSVEVSLMPFRHLLSIGATAVRRSCSTAWTTSVAWRHPVSVAASSCASLRSFPVCSLQRRTMCYSTFGAMRGKKSAARSKRSRDGTGTGDGNVGEKVTDVPLPRAGTFSSTSTRPLQSSVQRQKEAGMAFPKTLKSGRPAQQNTISQQLFYANSANAADMARQQQLDREYTQQMRELHAKRGSADRRFFQRMTDYRDIHDGDPYASVFGESGGTQRLRTAAWQRQFEKENEDVELPYERTNVLARLAPNWFVRYFVNLRDKGGADHLYFLWACALTAASLLWVVGYLFYTAPSRARPTSEIR